MRIERFGTGPRVFFGLHGWSGDHRTFAPLAEDLPPDVTFYAADLPGCGASPAPRAWTIEAVAEEIGNAIALLRQPVTLVGNCTGANLGLFVAARAPEQVQRLVTIDAFAYWPWYFRVFVNPVFGRYAYFTTFANPLGRWLTNLSLRKRRREETSLTSGFSEVDHRATYKYLSMLHNAGDVQQFRGLTMPVDLTYGANSFAAVKESARQMAGMWPQARVNCLAGAGHLPIREATAALRDILFSPAGNSEDQSCHTHSTSFAT